jgi:hypothetical protein
MTPISGRRANPFVDETERVLPVLPTSELLGHSRYFITPSAIISAIMTDFVISALLRRNEPLPTREQNQALLDFLRSARAMPTCAGRRRRTYSLGGTARRRVTILRQNRSMFPS